MCKRHIINFNIGAEHISSVESQGLTGFSSFNNLCFLDNYLS